MPETNETALAFARLEGMLNAVLPQHTARLDEHDRAITGLAAIVTQQGQDIASVKAVATERALDRRTTPPWVGIVGVVLAVVSAVVAIYALTH